jgi:tetratricopeptide (TPR) repeat protein
MSLTVILAACACRLWQLAAGVEAGKQVDPHASHERLGAEMAGRPRIGWAAATVTLAAIGVAMAGNLLGPVKASADWEQYLAVAEVVKTDTAAVHDHETNDAALWHLQNALAAHPENERAHLRMATALLLRFEIAQQSPSGNSMPLYHIRDVVLASQFPTAEARDQWLTAAVGENLKLLQKALFHTYRALQLCPLQGEAYIYLAQLDFLRSAPAEQRLYVDQALRLRPRSGVVLMAAGMDAAQTDDMETAIGYWKTAFHQNPLLQSRLIELVAPHMPPSVFIAHFQPDRKGMERLFQYYRDVGDAVHAVEVGRQHVALLEQDAARETGQAAARLWLRAYEVHQRLGDQLEKLACIGRAVECSPRDFDIRRTLALELLVGERFDEAVEQLRWCLSRQPQDAAVKHALAKAARGRLERTSNVTSAAGDRQGPPR